VKSLLSAAGIRHYVKGEVLQELFRVGTAEIQVDRDDETEARNLLRERTIEPGEAG
jgi:HEPN domain-containing protein